ncbi:MAG: DUF2306 domain-containing protein [Bacteroidota bacterium]
MLAIINPSLSAKRLLKISVNACFSIMAIGQFIFSLYIFGLYAVSGLAGDFERWNAAAPEGHVEGDLLGNVFFGLHVILAGIITVGGPVQLIKGIRKKFPGFHRINGRVYIGAAFLISFAGLYLVLVRGTVGGLTGRIFVIINAILIMISAFYAVSTARNDQLAAHRKWAIRLFLCMSGVWFFRVFLMLWLTIHQAPVGFDPDTFQGPALSMLYVFSYILPILFAELYFWSKRKGSREKSILSVFLIVLSICILVGTLSATMGMWLPRLN